VNYKFSILINIVYLDSIKIIEALLISSVIIIMIEIKTEFVRLNNSSPEFSDKSVD